MKTTMDSTTNVAKGKAVSPLVSTREVVRALPQFFASPATVILWAEKRIIPSYVFPSGTKRRCRYLFRVGEVRRAVECCHQEAR